MSDADLDHMIQQITESFPDAAIEGHDRLRARRTG
jgi:hypothetical protein